MFIPLLFLLLALSLSLSLSLHLYIALSNSFFTSFLSVSMTPHLPSRSALNISIPHGTKRAFSPGWADPIVHWCWVQSLHMRKKGRTKQAQQKNNIKDNGANKSNQVKWHVMRASGGWAGRHGGPTRAGILLVWRPRRCRTTQHRQRQHQQQQQEQCDTANALTAKSKTQKLFCYLCGQFAAVQRRRHSVRRQRRSAPQESSRERVALLLLLVCRWFPACR